MDEGMTACCFVRYIYLKGGKQTWINSVWLRKARVMMIVGGGMEGWIFSMGMSIDALDFFCIVCFYLMRRGPLCEEGYGWIAVLFCMAWWDIHTKYYGSLPRRI